jgi:uncharacterized protein
MAGMNSGVVAELENAVLCWFASLGTDGTPNVSPKEIFSAHADGGLVIADIASPVSVKNVRQNPNVCVSFVDVFRQRGFKLIGSARVVDNQEDEFGTFASPLITKAANRFEIKNVLHVRVRRVSWIWAPSYFMFPEQREEERMLEAYRAYGVRPHTQ